MSSVVTGASGHVGAALVRSLLSAGRTVKVIDLDPGIALDGLALELHLGDIRDTAAVET